MIQCATAQASMSGAEIDKNKAAMIALNRFGQIG
jgi:hypothetical protein